MIQFPFFRNLAISFLLSFGVTGSVYAQWEQLEKPYGGEVHAIVQMGNTIYAGGNHLFTSADSGHSWQVLSAFEKGNVFSLLVFNEYLFAGTSSDLYRSADAGQTWVKLNIPAPLNGVNQLCRMNNTLIINTGHAQTPEIYLSEDNGDSWNLSEQEPEDGFIRSVTSIGQIVYACGAFGIYRSTDEGQHWEVFTKDLQNTETLTYANNTFIAARWMACYRSADGVTWETIYNDLNIPVFILPLDSVSGNAQRLIMGTTTNGPYPGGLFYSDDNGSTWSSIKDVNNGNNKIFCILKSDTFLLTGTGSDAILRSDVRGDRWSVSNTGIKNRRFYKVASGGDLLVASEINERAIFSSGDHGKTWQFQGIPSNDYEYVTCLSVRDDWIFLGTIDKLYRKKMSDTAWITAIEKNHIGNITTTGHFVYVATWHSFYRSENYGATWKTYDFGDEIIWDILAHDSTVCVITKNYIHNSTDAGDHFSSTANPYFYSDYHASTNDGDTFYIVADNNGVYRSGDGGVNWEQMCDTVIWFPTAVSANAGTIFISTESGGVIRSTDNGRNWSNYSDDIPETSTLDLTIMGDTLYTVGYKVNESSDSWAGLGIMKRSAYPAGTPRINDLQAGFNVYPNPASGCILLQVQGKDPSVIQYSICTMSGTLLKSGHTRIDECLNVKDLPSGMYIISISGQKQNYSTRFIIM